MVVARLKLGVSASCSRKKQDGHPNHLQWKHSVSITSPRNRNIVSQARGTKQEDPVEEEYVLAFGRQQVQISAVPTVEIKMFRDFPHAFQANDAMTYSNENSPYRLSSLASISHRFVHSLHCMLKS
jgi:hypothetical protein